jgi:hypothetical protein
VRLPRVDDGQSFGQRIKLRVVGVVMGGDAPDILKTLAYRPELWGAPMSRITQAVLRGPSPWSVADRELLAAFVSTKNQCLF